MKTNRTVVFVSYSPFDLRHDEVHLVPLLERLSEELRLLTRGRAELFYDRGISPGNRWTSVLDQYLVRAGVFLALLTPKYFKSTYCRREAERFLGVEAELGRSDMVIPVQYIGSWERVMESGKLGHVLAQRQALDWRGLRFVRPGDERVREAMQEAARRIIEIL